MVRFRSPGERSAGPPAFDLAPLDIRDASFPILFGLSNDFSKARSEQRVRHVYLNDPALQATYPLGLRHFLEWLTTHGRADQQLGRAQAYWLDRDGRLLRLAPSLGGIRPRSGRSDAYGQAGDSNRLLGQPSIS